MVRLEVRVGAEEKKQNGVTPIEAILALDAATSCVIAVHCNDTTPR
jgi:predicted amidohydrolase